MPEGIVATPPKLRKLAAAQSVEPRELLQRMVNRHGTDTAASAELGISRQTFRNWRRIYGVHIIR